MEGDKRKMTDDLLEKEIERRVCDYAGKLGCKTYKFVSPSHRAVPDRIIVFPNGWLVFIEFKRAGQLPTRSQAAEIGQLRERGQIVRVIDNVDDGRLLIDEVVRMSPTSNTTVH